MESTNRNDTTTKISTTAKETLLKYFTLQKSTAEVITIKSYDQQTTTTKPTKVPSQDTKIKSSEQETSYQGTLTKLPEQQ